MLPKPRTTICPTCQNFTSFKSLHYIQFTTITSAAQAGCAYCDIIRQILHGLFYAQDIEHVTIDGMSDWDGFFYLLAVNLRQDYRLKDDGERGAASNNCREYIAVSAPPSMSPQSLMKFIKDKSPGGWVNKALCVPDNPSSDKSFAFVASCLEQCRLEHQDWLCGSVDLEKKLPTRVLKIERTPEVSIRVVKYHASFGPYLALSHCWGNNLHCRLISSTTDFFEGIPLQKLPSTFQDAVRLATHLDYTYLWIDSLCIIQDDKDDWDMESAKMGDIYCNAELTIAATSSENSDVSFLEARHRPRPPQLDVTYKDSDQSTFKLQASRCLTFHEYLGDEAGPLQDRAWAFQESVLAKRVISYGNEEITFRCRTHRKCQCLQEAEPLSRFLSTLIYPELFSHADLLSGWFHIVEIYSARDLTFRNDRLAALSGVASHIQQACEWTYVAGIWREWCIECLAWYSSETGPADTPATSVSPSLSWASVSGRVAYKFNPDKPAGSQRHSTLIALHFRLLGQNPFNRVDSGTCVELQGPLLDTRIRYNEDGFCLLAAEYDGCTWGFRADTYLKALLIGSDLVPARSSEPSLEELDGCSAQVLFLTKPYSDLILSQAIVLRRLRQGDNAFERVGIFNNMDQRAYQDLRANRSAKEIESMWLGKAQVTRLKIF